MLREFGGKLGLSLTLWRSPATIQHWELSSLLILLACFYALSTRLIELTAYFHVPLFNYHTLGLGRLARTLLRTPNFAGLKIFRGLRLGGGTFFFHAETKNVFCRGISLFPRRGTPEDEQGQQVQSRITCSIHFEEIAHSEILEKRLFFQEALVGRRHRCRNCRSGQAHDQRNEQSVDSAHLGE
jgi:hypothetical protein